MNISEIIKARKRNNKEIISPWKLLEDNGKERIGYLFAIHSSEEFNGDLTGINELLNYNDNIVCIDLFNVRNVKTDKYKNLELLINIKNLREIALKKEYIKTIDSLNFILHLKNINQILIYDIAANIHSRLNLENNRAAFFKKFKYYINCYKLIK